MPAFEVLDRTSAGKAKVRYKGIEQVGYRDLEAGESISQQSYAASVGNTRNMTVVQDSETGRFIDRVPQDQAIEVEGAAEPGERGATETNPTFELEVDGTDHARRILEQQRSDWEAFQVYGLWSFRCKNQEGDERMIVNGWSKVHDSIDHFSIREPVVDHSGETSEVVGWEEIEGDTVDAAFREASNHAWSKADCSVISWRNEKLELKLYAPQQSDWARQANQQTHIIVEGAA